MAWRYAFDAYGEPRTQFDFQREACTTRAIQSLDWEMTDRQAQIFWDAAREPEHDASSFAVGGEGLASARGAADARNKVTEYLKRGGGFSVAQRVTPKPER